MRFLIPFGGVTRREVQNENIKQQVGEDSMDHQTWKHLQK
jgi:hypothetical protein